MRIKMQRIFIWIVIFMALFGVVNKSFADSGQETSLNITPGNSVSDDSNGYMSLIKFSGDVIDGEWVNYLEYDNTDNRGSSRLTFKVDKDFISDDDNYYDISIDYFDAGIGAVLLQSSLDENNTMNYPLTGYGAYVEEEYWSWGGGYYYANISFNLTNTYEWKTHTFRVTDEFFEDNVDNYIHFYFGRDQNFGDTLRVKNMTLTKRLFKVDSIDENTVNNEPLIGNIYTDDNFGMGFKVYNSTDEARTLNISYKIKDANATILFEEDCGEIVLESKGTEKFYITDSLEMNGTYTLHVEVDNNGVIETESIKFSKMASDLSNKNNDFLGFNTFFGYSGWGNSRQIEDAVETGTQIGVKDIRTFINASFVAQDKNSGYTNELGRYEAIYDQVIDYGQNILVPVDPTGSTDDEILANAIESYEALARKYGDDIEYYEILNEMNLVGESWYNMTAEDYAEILVKAGIAIKEIDSNAKIVGIDSNRIPIYDGDDNSKSWIGTVLETEVEVDDNGDGTIDRTVTPLEIIDVISVHPYTDTYIRPPESAGSSGKSILEQLEDLREFINEYKQEYSIEKDIPVWLTEVGYQTSSLYGVNEEQQASYLSRFLIWSLANSSDDSVNIEKVYIYSLQGTGFSNTHPESNYGIMDGFKNDNLKGYTRDVEMAAKEAYIAIDMYNDMLTDATILASNKDTSDEDGFYWYKFRHSDDENIVIAMWNNDENTDSTSVNVNLPKGSVTVYDMFGNVLNEFNNSAETSAMNISYKPIYVVVDEADNIENAEISYLAEHEYDGTEKTPEVTVILGNKTLTLDVDYRVSYLNNINVGEGKIIIEGINNYIGSIEKTFTISALKAEKEAPGAFELAFELNPDGSTYTATIPLVDGCTYSFDGINYGEQNTKDDCLPNTSYTGYVKYLETETTKESPATSSTKVSPQLPTVTELKAPVITLMEGPTNNKALVGITCVTSEVRIYYTVDGSIPTTSSTEYTTAFSVDSNTTIRAIAVTEDMACSEIVTARWFELGNYGKIVFNIFN